MMIEFFSSHRSVCIGGVMREDVRKRYFNMKPITLQSGIIYGPVSSRRLGRSLGLNASPTSYKLCSFNCVYCEYGCTSVYSIEIRDRLSDFPAPDDFERALETALRDNDSIDNITFSGNGEPTLHPRFDELVDIARHLRDRYFPHARLGILSNASTIDVEKVFRALANLNYRIMKLDTGKLETFRKLNRPCGRVDYKVILDGLCSLENVTLQTMFIDGRIQNVGDDEIRAWIERIGEIKPTKVQIYSLHRPPAEPSLLEVPQDRLRKIATRAEETTGVPIEVIVAASPYVRKPRRYWG